ncbi:hypothetical protein D9M68_861050 [compost metagenome]
MSELEILFPRATSVRIGRRIVNIRPVQFQQFDEFGRASAVLLAALASGEFRQIFNWGEGNQKLLHSILLNCTDLSKWRIGRLPAVIAVELMLHVIAQNSRFFEQALVNATQLLAGDGSPKN